ncbi:sensor domain-containing diguanylate cyclase [Acidimicrobiaceae bacterium AH-315-P05]|nr:sensor domain-containing diguanylate cyclase [Acidimicrobiaceae bacterium AH-315-P05]
MSLGSIDERVAAAVQRAKFTISVLVDNSLAVIWMNDAASTFFGDTLHNGKAVLDCVHPEDLEDCVTALSAALTHAEDTLAMGTQPISMFLRVIDGEHKSVTVEVSVELHLTDPAITGIMISFRKISNRLYLDRTIELLADDADLDTTLHAALSYLSEEVGSVAASITTRIGGELILIRSPTTGDGKLAELYEGWGPLGVEKLREPVIHNIDELEPAESALARAAGVSHVVSLPIRDNNDHVAGAIVWWTPYTALFADPPNGAGRFVSRIVRLAILQERARRSLLHQTRHDPLTGLANRTGLDRVLDNLTAEDLPVGLLYCDLDQFKRINDTFGHSVGDIVLRQVARRIGVAIRADDVAVRMGGDEFVVVCPRVVDVDTAAAITERVRNRVEQSSGINETGITPYISIGYAVANYLGDLGTLVESADDALYENKRSRKLAPE